MSELARQIIEEVHNMTGGKLPAESEGVQEVMGDCEAVVDDLLSAALERAQRKGARHQRNRRSWALHSLYALREDIREATAALAALREGGAK